MKKDLGAILLISGTTIGAGMLALPTVTGPLGLLNSCLVYVGIFFIMLLSAKYLVNLVLYFDKPYNFVELAKKTLGYKGEALCLMIYLLLMYALVAAYMSASTSIFVSVFHLDQKPYFEPWLIFALPVLFALFLSFGLRGLDSLNRFFMMGLGLSFIGLCFYLAKTLNFEIKHTTSPSLLFKALSILITSFGYHIIIPTISKYLDKDRKRISRAIFIGSIIPLMIYLLWHFLIYFNVQEILLKSSLSQDIPITEILGLINPKMKLLSYSFALFAIITSFIGVSLGLFDFLRDTLPIKTVFKDKKILFALTFLPPTIYIFYFKKAFFLALDHAGILVCLLLIILPGLMHLKIHKKSKWGALFLVFFGLFVIITDIVQKMS
jgi:tyrosine-specific transport protein